MTNPSSGGAPDPYQPQQPYGPAPDPTVPHPIASNGPDADPASGDPASGDPAGWRPTPGYPAGEQPAPGYPTSEPPASGFPADQPPAPGYPTSGQPSPGYPAGGQPSPEFSPYPSGGQAAGGYPPAAGGYPPPYQGGSQPYYAPPGYGGAPAYGYVRSQGRTNPLAIAALACALGGLFTCISAPVGVVLGHVARRQIRQTGEQGEGMVTAALWVGYIFTFVAVLVLLAWLAFAIYALNHNGG